MVAIEYRVNYNRALSMKKHYYLPTRVTWTHEVVAAESSQLQRVILSAVRRAIETVAVESAEIVSAGDFASTAEAHEPFSPDRYRAGRGMSEVSRMPDVDVRATGNRSTNRPSNGEGGGASPRPSAKTEDPIRIKVRRDSTGAFDRWTSSDVLSQLERRLGIGRGAGAENTREIEMLMDRIGSALSDFEGRSKQREVTLLFYPPQGWGWGAVNRSPRLLYHHVRVQNELQVEDERFAQQIRAKEERREKDEQDRATAALLARAREQDNLDRMIDQEIQNIIKEVMWWEAGSLYGGYANGRFVTQRFSPVEHKDYSRAKIIYNSADHRVRIGRALRNAYYNPGKVQVLYDTPAYSEVVEDAATTPEHSPQGIASTTTEDCEALLKKGRHDLYEECLKAQRRQLGADVVEATKSVTEPIAAVVDAVNPVDPANWILIGAVRTIGKVGKALYVMKAAAKGRGVYKATRFGRSLQITGDAIQFEKSQLGHHVYEYLDKEGKLLYVGKSGGVQGPINTANAANSWVDRLQESHIATDWVFEARRVRVTHDLTEQEMWALEDVLIPTARHNISPGDYLRKFPGGDASINAAYALKREIDNFSFEVIP